MACSSTQLFEAINLLHNYNLCVNDVIEKVTNALSNNEFELSDAIKKLNFISR